MDRPKKIEVGRQYVDGKLVADYRKEYVYEFVYNDALWESSARTVSIHKTRKGAEMALDFHKINIIKEEDLGRRSKEWIDEQYYWGILETELKE